MAGGIGVGARIGPGGGAIMRALAWNPEHALIEPARLEEANIEQDNPRTAIVRQRT